VGNLASRSVEPGKVVTPGRKVMTVADLSQVEMKICVDETQLGRVKPVYPVKVPSPLPISNSNPECRPMPDSDPRFSRTKSWPG
jgi:hypothetical protein